MFVVAAAANANPFSCEMTDFAADMMTNWNDAFWNMCAIWIILDNNNNNNRKSCGGGNANARGGEGAEGRVGGGRGINYNRFFPRDNEDMMRFRNSAAVDQIRTPK